MTNNTAPNPYNIYLSDDDGRYYWHSDEGPVDVTDFPFLWRCKHGVSWRATIPARTAPDGHVGAPTCGDCHQVR